MKIRSEWNENVERILVSMLENYKCDGKRNKVRSKEELGREGKEVY